MLLHLYLYFLDVPCTYYECGLLEYKLVEFSTLKMKAAGFSKTVVHTQQTHDVTSQKSVSCNELLVDSLLKMTHIIYVMSLQPFLW